MAVDDVNPMVQSKRIRTYSAHCTNTLHSKEISTLRNCLLLDVSTFSVRAAEVGSHSNVLCSHLLFSLSWHHRIFCGYTRLVGDGASVASYCFSRVHNASQDFWRVHSMILAQGLSCFLLLQSKCREDLVKVFLLLPTRGTSSI